MALCMALELFPPVLGSIGVISFFAGAIGLLRNQSLTQSINLAGYGTLAFMLTLQRTFMGGLIWNTFQSLALLIALFISHGVCLLYASLSGSLHVADVSMKASVIGFLICIVYGTLGWIMRDVAIKLACIWSWYAVMMYTLLPSPPSTKAKQS